jgi:flagella basal body P-ring formation protein FlgA
VAAVRAALPPGSAVELIDYSRFLAPEGEIGFPRSGLSVPPGVSPARPVTWRGALTYTPGRSVPVWARIRAHIPATRVVAAEGLPGSKPIAPGQVRLETIDVFPLPELAAAAPAEFIGKIPRRAIRAGQVLTPDLVAAAPEVERGSSVQVTARSGAALLRFPAVAIAGGRRGETILLRNPANGSRFRAEITSKGEAAALEPSSIGKAR